MKKSSLLKIINPILGLIFLSQVITGVFHDYLMELSYEAFELIHGKGGYILVLLVIAHLYLNWTWINNTFFKIKH